MTKHSPIAGESPDADDALQRRTHLCSALALVELMADEQPTVTCAGVGLHAAAYLRAAPVAQRRYHAVAEEAGASAAAGVAALVRHREATGRDCAAAAEHLAGEIRAALATLDRIVPTDPA